MKVRATGKIYQVEHFLKKQQEYCCNVIFENAPNDMKSIIFFNIRDITSTFMTIEIKSPRIVVNDTFNLNNVYNYMEPNVVPYTIIQFATALPGKRIHIKKKMTYWYQLNLDI